MEMIVDNYTSYMTDRSIALELINELNKQNTKLENLLAIQESIETYGLDSSVMDLINKDNQLVRVLGLTENDLNKSQEGLLDVFKTGIGKTIVDTLKWVIAKISECIKWIFDKLMSWAKSVNANKFRVAADVWSRIPDSARVKKNPSRADGAWVDVPDFEACKERLELSEHICSAFVSVLASEFELIVNEYANGIKTKNPIPLNDIIQKHDKICKVIVSTGSITAKAGHRLQQAVRTYHTQINKEHLDKDLNGVDPYDLLYWKDATAVPRIVQVEYKRDLKIKYKGEFSEVGVYTSRVIYNVENVKPKLNKLLADLTTIYNNMSNDLRTPNLDQKAIAYYTNEQTEITDIGGAITYVLNVISRHMSNCAVATMGINEVMDDIIKMFR